MVCLPSNPLLRKQTIITMIGKQIAIIVVGKLKQTNNNNGYHDNGSNNYNGTKKQQKQTKTNKNNKVLAKALAIITMTMVA